jgi:hypothetical protein
MCKDNVNLPKEANKAKCFVIACFVFSLFSMIGFGAGWAGAIGAVCGLLACIGSSILMCCAPASAQEGGGKFTAAGVLLLIAGIIQAIMSVTCLGLMIALLNEVNESSFCKDRYVSCTSDSDGNVCADSLADDLCYRNCVGDDHCADWQTKGSTTCSYDQALTMCNNAHGGAKTVVSGIIVVVYGITIAFLLIAGTLNIIGGAYCIKAKGAITAMQANGPPAAGAVAVPTVAGAVAVPAAVAVPMPAGKV